MKPFAKRKESSIILAPCLDDIWATPKWVILSERSESNPYGAKRNLGEANIIPQSVV